MVTTLNRPNAFLAFQEMKERVLSTPPPRLPAEQSPLMRMAHAAEAQSIRELKEDKRKLYAVKLPLASLLGVMLYQILTATNQDSRIAKDFLSLITAHETTVTEIRHFFDEAARNGRPLSQQLKSTLQQVVMSLQSGNPPSVTKDIIKEAQQLGASTPALDRAVQRYLESAERIMANKRGLMNLAAEPLILRELGMSKSAAQALVRNNREGFLQPLFRKVLAGGDLKKLTTAFNRLNEVHFRIARLVAAGVAIGLGAYFTLDNEMKAGRIYARGL